MYLRLDYDRALFCLALLRLHVYRGAISHMMLIWCSGAIVWPKTGCLFVVGADRLLKRAADAMDRADGTCHDES